MDDTDLLYLIAAANVCDEIVGRRHGTAERRYTANGAYSLAEGRIEITRKIAAVMAGVLVVSGGRFFVHAGAPALPAATITSTDLRGSVTVQGSRPRRDLFNGVRAVYVGPAKAGSRPTHRRWWPATTLRRKAARRSVAISSFRSPPPPPPPSG